MTPRAASTFNRRLGLHGVFKAGRSLGSASATTHLGSLTFSGGQIDISVDGTFREKLRGVEADVRSPTVSMPIQNGRIASDLTGYLSGEDGFTFLQHEVSEFGEPFDRTIGFLTTFVSFESHTVSGGANVNFGSPRLPYSGPVATLPSSPVQFNSETGEAGASLPMALDLAMANLLNETIGASRGKPSLFSAGEPLGTIGFTARTR